MEKRVTFRGWMLPLLLIAPQVVISAVFFFYPAGQAIWQSLFIPDPFGLSSQFVGMGNFEFLLGDKFYRAAFLTTAIFSILVTLCSMIPALFLAVLADRLIKGSGVDTDRFKPMPEPDGPIIAAVVSRMLKDKGVREVVFAARELKRRNVQVEIWLVGDPDIENPTSLSRNELDQWAAEGCIRWRGHQSDIASIWAQAHIALLPSYHEGMPKALLEAAACGRPMIASDVPGCNELVVDGENGLLVPIRDWVQLADAIQLLAGSQKLRAKLGRAARETICADYGQQKILESTQMLYQRALAESA